MPTYTAKVEYIDRRDIIIEADSFEEAQAKYERGEWTSEDTYDFFSNREIQPLQEGEA
tara:strand:- start:212 stop:385 length:174 start_codon:yes stop_codon:yes gene_type:complete